ncbi:hypothetical protein Q3G72_023955 [Acer saccharum]|nr:hypothetical protein Q3G72_023955 [Acer saccharum]
MWEIDTDKEVHPYGPWLLVSYGKQGNRNFKGKVGKVGSNNAGGNANYGSGNYRNGFTGNSKPGVDGINNMSGYRNGDVRSGVTGNANLYGNIKYGSVGFNRKMNGDWSEVKHGKKDSLRSGRDNKSADGTYKTAGNSSSGSRFEVLNEEGEVNVTEENLMPNISAQEGSNSNAKVALTEITNIGRKQNVKPGKGMKKISKKPDRLGIKKIGFQGECSYFKGNMNMTANSQDQNSALLDNESEGQDSANVLRLFHKEVQEFEDKREAVVGDGSIRGSQNNYGMNIDDSFVAVVSRLEEAMVAITE